jgi:outer membrane protein OmpA-like peptidoglycan-associated protein
MNIFNFFAGMFLVLFLGSCSSTFLKDIADKSNTDKYIEFINKNAPSEDAFVAVQRLAGMAVKQKKWDEAVEIFTKYKPLFPDMESRFEKIIQTLKAPSQNLIVEKLPNTINDEKGNSYIPLITADNKRMYFCSNSRLDGFSGEDIYYSDYINGNWTKAKILPKLINGDGNQAPSFVSLDGNTVYYFNSYMRFAWWKIPITIIGILGQRYIPPTSNVVRLSYTNRIKGENGEEWTEFESLPEPIESSYWQAANSITNDGKAIFFSSDRPGGIGDFHKKNEYFHGSYWGNIDIYVSVKDDKGNWGEPINVGNNINTPYADKDPFIHPDGKTLFFSSDGHNGFGNLDVYYSRRLSDTSWTEWSEPVNLGKDVNTIFDDWGYKISLGGDVAYFAKEEDNKNNIYSIKIPKVTDAVAVLSGIVKDEKGNLLSAQIKWKVSDSSKIAGELTTNPNTGSYFTVLQLGKKWVLFVAKEGYYQYTKEIDLTNTKESVDIIEDIILKQAPNAIIHGIVTDQKKTPIESSINCIDLETGQSIVKISSGVDGKYSFTLPLGKNYSVSYDKEKYISDSKNFNLKTTTEAQDITQDIILNSIESAIVSEKAFVLNNIFFDFNSDILKPESYNELDNLFKFLKANPTVNIKICGHTDSVGVADYNLKLSGRRAAAVKNYLITKGINASNLESEGFGENKFIAPNSTDEGMAKNRRVEFIFIKK